MQSQRNSHHDSQVLETVEQLQQIIGDKVSFDQMTEFEENILKKIDEISFILIEKFALKEETIKALKFVENRVSDKSTLSRNM